jgi:DNA modification methylase
MSSPASSRIIIGDCLDVLRGMEAESVHACVTSPPYWGLRDYGVDGQIGLEKTPEEFVARMTTVFHEVFRVLRPDGTLWLNIGDCYASGGGNGEQGSRGQRFDRRHTQENLKRNSAVSGLKPKDLVGIPWALAFALRADGWYLRQEIIWHKPNPMPESIRDRCTKAHEQIFLLTKSRTYFYDADAIREPAIYKNVARMPPAGWGVGDEPRNSVDKNRAEFHRKSQPKGSFQGKHGERAFRKTGDFRNKRTVWTVAPRPFKGAHFATFPPALIEPCILAGSPAGGTVLDPFSGAGTTGVVALKHGRNYIGIEINPEYAAMSEARIAQSIPAQARIGGLR